MSNLSSNSVEIKSTYRRIVEKPYCCMPAVLLMVFERRGITVHEQDEIGYELGLVVPETVAHRFNRVRTESTPPLGGWGTQTRLEEFSIQQYIDRHHLPLRFVEHPVSEIEDLEAFITDQLKQGNDVIAFFDKQYLFGIGDTEHVALVQAMDCEFIVLVDPAEDSPDLCYVQRVRFLEALRKRTTDRIGLWVISGRS